MKKINHSFIHMCVCLVMGFSVVFGSDDHPDNVLNITANFTAGSPEVLSIGELAFGPQGILFFGDADGDALFAIDTKDTQTANNYEYFDVLSIDKKLAALVGKTRDDITINDMAVNPLSKNVYLSLSVTQNDKRMPLLIKMDREGKLTEVALANISYFKLPITNALPKDNARHESTITDIVYYDGNIYFSGLSNEEFSSTLRKVTFPFKEKTATATGLEVYHASHHKFETRAPITSMMPIMINGQLNLMAGYGCTPIALFPVDKLTGGKIRGKAIADLGAGNAPIDMISFENNGKKFVLISNYHRNMMVVDCDQIIEARELTADSREKEFETLPQWQKDIGRNGLYFSAGLKYVDMSLVDVLQLDKIDDTYIAILQRDFFTGLLDFRARKKPYFYDNSKKVVK
ncbi:hypothetical protein K1X84_09740 [bacterium]|nr:hypothetical protein [bacterium]